MTHHHTPQSDRKNLFRVNLIAWLLMLIMPVALILLMEQIGFKPNPAGEVQVCQRPLNALATARITVEPLLVGQVPHQAQHLELIAPTTRGEWQTLINMTLNLPDITPNCDANIGIQSNLWWFWNGKTITITPDEGITWHTWQICDPPRPEFGCVRDEHIRAVTYTDNTLIVDVFAREGDYQIQTQDAGITWLRP